MTLEAMKDVRAYCAFRDAVSLGLTIGVNDIPFDRAMIFGWIKDVVNVRKN
jgi:hypothetical protein